MNYYCFKITRKYAIFDIPYKNSTRIQWYDQPSCHSTKYFTLSFLNSLELKRILYSLMPTIFESSIAILLAASIVLACIILNRLYGQSG